MFTNDIWQEKTIEFLVYGEIVRSEINAKLKIGNIEILNCWPYLVVVYVQWNTSTGPKMCPCQVGWVIWLSLSHVILSHI